MLYAIVAILVIVADQWLKYWVAGNIAINTGVKELVPGVISLVNIHNDGAAFGIFSGGNARMYFIIICVVFTAAIIVALATKFISGGIGRWSAVFIMAGGIANCIDRIIFGYVQDMFRLDFVNFAIFNVADIFITLFCIILIVYLIFGGEKPSKRKEREDESYEEFEEERMQELYVEEDDEEEDETPVHSFLNKKKEERRDKGSRKDRQARYADEFEQFKAARAARIHESGSPARPAVQTPPPAIDPNDPFAEWERANARIEQEKRAPYADFMSAEEVFAVNTQPAPETQPVAEPLFEAPAPTVEEPVFTAEEPKFEPTSAQAKPKASNDFDLDDILAEFK